MDLSKLAELKRKLSFDGQLAPVMDYFMANFADHAAFVRQGERAAPGHFVESIIDGLAKSLFTDPGPITRLALQCLPEHHFVHGSFFVGRRIGCIFFFEDIEVGLLAVCDAPGSPEVKYLRFSDAKKRKPGDPTFN